MPEELDPTTARLISELSASMLPVLTKSLMSAIPSTDFSVAVERNNRTLQELRSVIEKALRSAADDSRAGRSMIIQSIGTVLEEITGLRAMLERLPEIISSAVKEIKDGSKERENEKEKDKTENNEDAENAGKITNTQGVELPSTGGIGTTMFYIIGAVLVIGAGILLVTRRRMNAN